MAIELPEEAEAWVESFRDRLNDNDAYAAAADGWGVGFDGDFVLEIGPDDTYDGEPLYLYLELRDGECLQTAVLDDPDEVAHGYTLKGSYSDWKRIIRGEADIVSSVMDGTLKVDGSKMQAMRYQNALVEMGETAARVETDFRY
ncbi:SCP2 sterol-binding domain-containing protein [Halapricum desulfuricans]|uniref:Sterol carrier protein n=1 Tax=Halapricum desulfuricans TaxID=2841257 RepID=A0A897NM51_9EURY|nr:SCP2 sterol-binding domain-containing protein [Halapricum desulfuricans]QSG13827.1 Sterol carrier protein [Halapricum desulfuricans]